VTAQPEAGPAPKRSVLVVGVDEELFAKVAPLLDRSEFDVDRFPRAGMALELVARVPFDVLLARHPLADIPVQEFLDAVRAADSPCRSAPLLLLVERGDLDAAAAYVGRGANRVVAVEESPERLQGEVSALLTVAPRSAIRLMVRLQVEIDDGRQLALCQSENVSETGMLVRSSEVLPLGTQLELEFFLGEEPLPVRGTAEVVRHTTPGREEVRGMGLRFLSLHGNGAARLRRFLVGQ
jgi:DNA-binding response OmpR family regulator